LSTASPSHGGARVLKVGDAVVYAAHGVGKVVAREKQKDIEYSIVSITGKDLVITKENEKVVVSFAYDKEVELVKPVFLLIKFEGRSN
jgi:hypothetical protein